jgi:hypothetical protein
MSAVKSVENVLRGRKKFSTRLSAKAISCGPWSQLWIRSHSETSIAINELLTFTIFGYQLTLSLVENGELTLYAILKCMFEEVSRQEVKSKEMEDK